jgi:GTP-binding protein LepA
MEKLQLNDASLVFLESSAALGLVSVVDFLECYTWNYSRRLDMSLMTVLQLFLTFRIMRLQKDPDTVLMVNNPSDLPEPSRLDHVESRL